MKKLAIIGAGGHGKVVAEAAMLSRCFDQIVFVDNTLGYLNRKILGIEVIAAEYQELSPKEFSIHIAVGDNRVRKVMYHQATALGFELATIIHPSAIISPTSDIKEGVVVMAGAVIQCDTYIGKCTIVNTGASVDHDCKVHDFAHLSPQVVLAGNVEIKEGCWIGAGAVCREKVTVNENVIIGANSFVNRSINDKNSVFYGSPIQKKL